MVHLVYSALDFHLHCPLEVGDRQALRHKTEYNKVTLSSLPHQQHLTGEEPVKVSELQYCWQAPELGTNRFAGICIGAKGAKMSAGLGANPE